MRRVRVGAILHTPDGILLAKHAFNLRFGLIGGGVKKNEPLEEAMKREIFEELRTTPSKINHLCTIHKGVHQHEIFTAEVPILSLDRLKSWQFRELFFLNKNNSLANIELSPYARIAFAHYLRQKKSF